MKQATLLTATIKSGLLRGQTKLNLGFGFCLDPVKVAISRLSDCDFDRMSRNELMKIVKISGLDHISAGSDAHLPFVDDHELRMLACLARLSCQRSVHSMYIERGKNSPFQGHVALN